MREHIENNSSSGPSDDSAPLAEPKTGIRPDTGGFGKHLEGPIQIDGAAARDGQAAQRA